MTRDRAGHSAEEIASERAVTVHLTRAIDLYRAMDMTFWLQETNAAPARVEGR